MRIPVEIGGNAMPAGKMEPYCPVAYWLQTVLAAQRIKIRSAHAHMLVQRGGRNQVGLRRDGEGQPVLGFPDVHLLKERQTAGEGRIADPAHAFMRKRGLNRVGETDTV